MQMREIASTSPHIMLVRGDQAEQTISLHASSFTLSLQGIRSPATLSCMGQRIMQADVTENVKCRRRPSKLDPPCCLAGQTDLQMLPQGWSHLQATRLSERLVVVLNDCRNRAYERLLFACQQRLKRRCAARMESSEVWAVA